AFHLQRIEKLLPDHEGSFDYWAFAEDDRYACAPTPRQNLAIKGHRAVRTHAGDYVGVTNRLDEEGKIGWVKLLVRRDQADHVLGCSRKAGVQRAAIAARTWIVDDPDMRGLDSQAIGDAAGLVRAAIVDDDDLVVVADLTQHRDRPFHRMLE